MKLSRAAYLLGSLMTLKVSFVNARGRDRVNADERPHVHTGDVRPPASPGATQTTTEKTGTCSTDACNKANKCCDGYTCTKKTCVLKRSGNLIDSFASRSGAENWYDCSMSHDGESILLLGGGTDAAYILEDKFKTTKQLPSYDYGIPLDDGKDFSWASVVSGDGATVVLSDYERSYSDTMKLFQSGWENISSESSSPPPSGDKYFGSSLALTYDGDVLMVGADYYNSCSLQNDIDCLYWVELSAETRAIATSLGWDATKWDTGGYPANINEYWSDLGKDDKKLLKEMGYKEDTWDNGESDYVGSVQRYEFNHGSNEWEPIGDKIVGENVYDQLGRYPLEITDNGDRILVGGGENGFASVYDWDMGAWQLRKRWTFNCSGYDDSVCDLSGIDAYDPEKNPLFGQEKTFMSKDGNIIAIGDESYDPDREVGVEGNNQGAIYFYKWKAAKGNFVKFATTLVGPSQESYFGYSFSMSDDGTQLVVADYYDSAVYLYKLITKGNKVFYKRDSTIQDSYADVVSLSRDGAKLTALDKDATLNTYQID